LSGQLDVQTCLVLESALDRLREAASTRVVVDLSGVTFCDSVGLSAFVVAHKYCTAAGGYLRLAAPTPFMIRLLQVVGIAGALPIYRTVQTACAGDPSGLVVPAGPQRDDAQGEPQEGVLTGDSYVLRPIGWVESPLTDRDMAPKQGDEGSPEAWLVFEPGVSEGIRDLHVGTDVIVLTWLDRARRDVLAVHPRGDLARPETGVFSTRSPDRPNPIGLHRVSIVSIDGLRVRVRHLEALDATPIVDVKPVLGETAER
jgi:tRNA-Thr(GGU) m(6)t(6)A37 methyltransferase TsaA